MIGVAVGAVRAGLVLPFHVGDEPTSSVAMVESAPSTTAAASESAATPNVDQSAPISGLGTGAAAPNHGSSDERRCLAIGGGCHRQESQGRVGSPAVQSIR